jgi:chromosome segregation ATPase/PAS domain-containing protein
VGASTHAAPELDAEVCDGVPAAIAVLRESGRVERATRAFVDRFDVQGGSWTSCADEVELITTGRADRLSLPLDGHEADLVAVVDRDGRRGAVLTISTTGDAADNKVSSPVMEEPLDESPAIIWLKDLDGRYLRVNRRYAEQLATDPESVRGRTDAELTAAGSIEGMRLEETDSAGQDPLELEYRIAAFEERPAFAALRFALRDADGQPTATCSVAARLQDAALARSECERLMRIDRWGRLDAFAIRQELLDDWGLTLADGSSGPPLDRDDRVAAALVERDQALQAAARLEQELSKEHEQRASLRSESERAAKHAQELNAAVAAAHARSDELEQSLARAEARVAEIESELTVARTELEEHKVRGERVAEALVERDEALATAAQLAEQLSKDRERLSDLRAESERAAQRAEEASDGAAAAQTRSVELETSLAGAEARVSELEGELTAGHRELEESLGRAEARASELAGDLEDREQSLRRAEARVGELEHELGTARTELEEHALGAERAADVLVERDEALAAAARLEEELSSQREQRASLLAESEHAARRAQELSDAAKAAEARSDELEQSLAGAEARVGELEGELKAGRPELERSLRDAETRVGELESELRSARNELEQSLGNAEARVGELEGALKVGQTELERTLARAEARIGELEGELGTAQTELEEHVLRGERLAEALVERDEALATAARLEQELSSQRDQRGSLHAESERAAQRAEELDGAVVAAQARSDELEQSLAFAEARVGELETELTAAQTEGERSLARAEARVGELEAELTTAQTEGKQSLARAEARVDELEGELKAAQSDLEQSVERAEARVGELEGELKTGRTELERALGLAEARVSELEGALTSARTELEEHVLRGERSEAAAAAEESNGVNWRTGSQRALSAALAGLTEWRSVLKHAVDTLGSEGGWDASIAWCPDVPSGWGSMRCGALWMREESDLSSLESRIWRHRQNGLTAEFGRARNRMATTCLLELESAEDSLLRASAADGIGSALLIPIGSGGEAIAMLELLSRKTTAPDAELMVSLEAIALQLGTTAELLKLADVPRWRTGRR